MIVILVLHLHLDIDEPSILKFTIQIETNILVVYALRKRNIIVQDKDFRHILIYQSANEASQRLSRIIPILREHTFERYVQKWSQ